MNKNIKIKLAVEFILLLSLFAYLVAISGNKDPIKNVVINKNPVNENEVPNDNHDYQNDIVTSSNHVKVHFIDVGQGDSTLIEYGDFHILIDAGNNWYGSDVVNYLKSLNVDDIEILVGTHPDADHIGGLDEVMDNFKVENIIDSCKSDYTKTYEDYVNKIQTQVTDGAKLSCAVDAVYQIDTNIFFQIIDTDVDSKDDNENSVLAKLVAYNYSFLFTGDLEEEIESTLLNLDINVDVYKVGHHGSDTASSELFLDKVKPMYAVISAGIDNQYGHPHNETIIRLQEYTYEIFSTALSGNIIFEVNPSGIVVDNYRKVEVSNYSK